MRIEPTSGDSKESTKVGKTKRLKSKRRTGIVEKEGEAGFLDVLLDVSEEEARAEAERMVKEVVDAGNRFARSPTRDNYRRYVEKIKRFLQYVERGLYRVRDMLGIETDEKKLYMVAEIVDEELKEIARLVFESEMNTLKLADKIERINGLLLDLYR